MLLLFTLLLLLQLGGGQLVGSLTRIDGTAEFLQATIINNSEQNVSVIALNNIFDLLHRSTPVAVAAADGSRLAVAASHLMYDGLFLEDLLTLAPGESFSRDFNLSYYLRPDDVDAAAGYGPLTVHLPRHFEGVLGNERSHILALNVSTNRTNEIGEIAAANLSTIVLDAPNITVQLPTFPLSSATPLNATTANPIYLNSSSAPKIEPVARRRRAYVNDEDTSDVGIDGDVYQQQRGDGIALDAACTGRRAARMRRAVRDVDLLAVAGMRAAGAGNYPASYFFRPGDEPSITRIMARVHAAAQSPPLPDSPAVDLLCTDVKNWCRLKRGRIRGYADNQVVAAAHQALSYVVLCPAAAMASAISSDEVDGGDGFGANGGGSGSGNGYLGSKGGGSGSGGSETPAPCTAKPAQTMRLGYVLLHELMHVAGVSEGSHIGDLEYGVRGCHSLVGNYNPASPRHNADNYAWLASWAWDLGFGDYGGKPCPYKWFESG